LSRRGRRLQANASAFDTHRDSITSFGDVVQRFASDSAVTRLIIVESQADEEGDGGGAGTITYNGPPAELPQSIQSRLGDGYAMNGAMNGHAKDAADGEAASSTSAAVANGESGEPTKEGEAAATPGDEDDAEAEAEGQSKAAPTPAPAAEEKKEDSSSGSSSEGGQGGSKGSIPGAVVAYCKRMGPWILVSAAPRRSHPRA
jgi:hypothetical protein